MSPASPDDAQIYIHIFIMTYAVLGRCLDSTLGASFGGKHGRCAPSLGIGYRMLGSGRRI